MREEQFSEQDMKYTIIDANKNQIEIGLHDNSDVKFIKVIHILPENQRNSNFRRILMFEKFHFTHRALCQSCRWCLNIWDNFPVLALIYPYLLLNRNQLRIQDLPEGERQP